MKKPSTRFPPPSPLQHNLSGFIRPAHPVYPPLSSQNQHFMMRAQETSVNELAPHPPHSSQNQYMMMRTLETSADELVQHQKYIQKQLKSDAIEKLATADYQPAKYEKALLYKNQRSYKKKIDNQYIELDLFCDTNQLRYFGLGTYFYIQFFRRMMWFFFILALINFFSIGINFKGKGLDNYSVSFSSYLMMSTLGNYSGSVMTSNSDGYIIVIIPALNFLALMIFYWVWKCHFTKAVALQEQDNKDVRPQKFCLEVQGLPEGYIKQDDLKNFFIAGFGQIYEVSLARKYDDKLPHFEEMDKLKERIKQLELELALDGSQKKQKKLQSKKEKLQDLQQKLRQMHIRPLTVSAFVHFQYENQKAKCISQFRDHYLQKNCFHSCMRSLCCCCIKSPDPKMVFHGKPLLISNTQPPHPQDINWFSYEIGFCNKLFRAILACVVILAFLALSCTIIGLCSLYITAHSTNCDGIDTSAYTSTTITQVADVTIVRCYCNANLVSSFTDQSIQTACNDYLDDIYKEQAIQYAVIITSAVTNFLFCLISDKLVNFVRPSSFSATLKYKTAILTVFMTFNSILIPVLIYANIFGFTPSHYVSFLTIIFTDVRNFFNVESLSFYPNFTAIWYRNVSPIFTNSMLFDTVGLWVSYIIFKCKHIYKDLVRKRRQNRILQKNMNNQITDFTLEIEQQAANLYLTIITACIFWSGIPVLVPLAFLNIMSRYIINRSKLQNHSIRIAGLGQEFNTFSFFVFPVILILFPPLAEWMLAANPYIYPSGLPVNFSLSFPESQSSVLNVQLYLPIYLGLSLLTLVEVIFYYSVIKCCNKVCSCLCKVCRKKQIQYHPRPFKEYTKSMNILCSYNVRNNDNMRNAILNLQKYLAKYDSR